MYVGFYYPESSMIGDLLKAGSVVDFPGYTFQGALLSGLDEYYPDMKVISSAYMSAYPKNKKLYFKKRYFSHKDNGDKKDVFTGLLNLPVIKEFSKFLRIRTELKNTIVKGEENVVICYETHTPFLMAIASLRRKLSKACLIVPDLPDFMTERKSWWYLWAKKIDKQLIYFAMKSFDCFVLFSPHMKERLKMDRKPWVQIEGIAKDNLNVGKVDKDSFKAILYTGNLGERTGIKDLLDAFQKIESPEYRLWIRGNGEGMKQEIFRRQKDDSRIVYYEPMRKEEILKLQRRATVLVNPIRPSQLQTRYFFPSKTMEYLASGTPTIMYKLDCLPKDYYQHVYFIEEETIDSFKDKLVEICEKDKLELDAFGQSAREFILNEKNPVKQAGKIYELLNRI